jgi:hypothetical protein
LIPPRTNSGFLALAVLCLSVIAPAQNKDAPARGAAPTPQGDRPSEEARLYRNSTFGFRYQTQYGWVDRTKEMQDGSGNAKGEVLLAVFERPPETTGDMVNSAVVIAWESAATYPGLKTAEDYVGPLTEIASAKGFKPDGDPYTVEEDGRQLLRSDFVKTMEGKAAGVAPGDLKLTMRQCTLVLLVKDRIVSFTFVAGSENDLDDLMDGLHFESSKSTFKSRP